MHSRRFTSWCGVAMLVVCAAGVTTVAAQPLPQLVSDEVLVVFASGVTAHEADAIASRHGLTYVRSSVKAGRFTVFTHPSPDAAVTALRGEAGVRVAERNAYAYADGLVPNDPYYGYQWHMVRIGMEQAWELARGVGVVVAVVDSGVDQGLEDLASTAFVAGWDFVNDDDDPTDDYGHGSHVAGTVAQSTNNGLGVTGVAWGAAVMPVKVLARSGRGSYSDIADGIYWAADHGAHVINLSLGGSVDSVVLEDACTHAWNAGVVIVASAGNESSSEPHYPSAYPVCISVSATTSADTLASYSNFGADVDLAAPGGDGTDRDGDGYGDGVLQNTFNRRNEEGYYFYTGTSMAAPHVAGVAALVKSADPALTAAEIRLILEDTAENIGDPWLFGNGLVDAEAAVTAAIGAVVNQLPIADFSFLASNLRVDFTDTSVDLDGTIVERWWSFGDGTSSTDANPEHIFASDGVYSVSLTVVDDDGGLDAVSQAVTVSSPATRGEAKMYVGNVVMSGRAQGVNFSATGVVTVLGNGGVPVAGATVVAAWSGVVSGDATGVTAADGTVTLDSPRVTTPGTFTLTVTGLEHADYSYHPRLDIVTEGTVTLD